MCRTEKLFGFYCLTSVVSAVVLFFPAIFQGNLPPSTAVIEPIERSFVCLSL